MYARVYILYLEACNLPVTINTGIVEQALKSAVCGYRSQQCRF